MATGKLTRTAREDARELARTPVANPYRGQLSDPFAGGDVPDDVALFVPRGRQVAVARPARAVAPPGPPVRRRAPGLVVTLAVLSLIEAAVVAVLGLLVIALVNLVNGVNGGDRSFYAGRDAGYVLLGVLDIGVAAALAFGAVAMMGGRVSGRIGLTAGQVAVLVFSVYWWGQDRVPGFIPFVLGAMSLGVLLLSYQASITRWLGVQRPPQPE